MDWNPPDLLEDFKNFEIVIDDYAGENSLNLSKIRFLTPTTLLPILHYARKNLNIETYVVNHNTTEYVKKVLGILDHTDTTLPFKKLYNNKYENVDLSSNFCNMLDLNYGGKNALMFLIDEIINNMHYHADFEVAHTLAQHYPNVGIADICFIDDGISIPGRFEESGFNFKDDCDAIYQAINGKSSDILKEGRRGTGLNSTINLVTRGNKGSVLIASRKGLCYLDRYRKEYKYIKDNYIHGTLV